MLRTRLAIGLALATATAGLVAFALPVRGQAAANKLPTPLPTRSLGLPTPLPSVVPCSANPLCMKPLPFYFGAVGDSFWSGEGASHDGTYASAVPGTEDWRHQSGLSPVHQAWMYLELGRRPGLGSYTLNRTTLQHSWGVDKFTFNASSGAETKHLEDIQWEDKAQTIKRNDPQLPTIDPRSQIVFFGLGGNDAGFGSMMETALKSYYVNRVALGLADDEWHQRQLNAVQLEIVRLLKRIPQVTMNVTQALSDVAGHAQGADIIVALYPVGVLPSGNAGTAEVYGPSMDAMYRFATAVNNAILAAVDTFRSWVPSVRVHVFDPNHVPDPNAPGSTTNVVAGHELGTSDPYFNGPRIRKDQLMQGWAFRAFQESFHPNEKGATAVGRALATWMAQEFPALFPGGPNFNQVSVNPLAAADDPVATQAAQDWATSHPDQINDLCGNADADSICQLISADGLVTIPISDWQHPLTLLPLPGAPVAGGSTSLGSPAGNPDPTTWITGGYPSLPTIQIPWQNPCYTFWDYRIVSPAVQVVTEPGATPIDARIVPSQPLDPCDVIFPPL
jgi:lysophospholipase L1-like esterase